MVKKIGKFLREHLIAWVVIAVVICAWEYMVIHFSPSDTITVLVTIFTVFVICVFLVMLIPNKKEAVSIVDSTKEFLFLDELIKQKLVQMGEEENHHIHKNWILTFQIYFTYIVRIFECQNITDFHIAAAVIYSLVWTADSVSHTGVIYQCVRELIFKPKMYDATIDEFDNVKLQVREVMPEKSMEEIPVSVSDEIAEVIMKKFIWNKDDINFKKLVQFLQDIYENQEEGALENLKAK